MKNFSRRTARRKTAGKRRSAKNSKHPGGWRTVKGIGRAVMDSKGNVEIKPWKVQGDWIQLRFSLK